MYKHFQDTKEIRERAARLFESASVEPPPESNILIEAETPMGIRYILGYVGDDGHIYTGYDGQYHMRRWLALPIGADFPS